MALCTDKVPQSCRALPSSVDETTRLVAAYETPVGRSKIFNYYIWIFDFVRAVNSTSLAVPSSGQSRCPDPTEQTTNTNRNWWGLGHLQRPKWRRLVLGATRTKNYCLKKYWQRGVSRANSKPAVRGWSESCEFTSPMKRRVRIASGYSQGNVTDEL